MPRFQGNQQQDAHEFMGDLLNALHDEMALLYKNSVDSSRSQKKRRLSESQAPDNEVYVASQLLQCHDHAYGSS